MTFYLHSEPKLVKGPFDPRVELREQWVRTGAISNVLQETHTHAHTVELTLKTADPHHRKHGCSWFCLNENLSYVTNTCLMSNVYLFDVTDRTHRRLPNYLKLCYTPRPHGRGKTIILQDNDELQYPGRNWRIVHGSKRTETIVSERTLQW